MLKKFYVVRYCSVVNKDGAFEDELDETVQHIRSFRNTGRSNQEQGIKYGEGAPITDM